MDPTYTGAFGRVRVYGNDFLPEDFIRRLMATKTIDEMVSELFGTFYRQDMELLRQSTRELTSSASL